MFCAGHAAQQWLAVPVTQANKHKKPLLPAGIGLPGNKGLDGQSNHASGA